MYVKLFNWNKNWNTLEYFRHIFSSCISLLCTCKVKRSFRRVTFPTYLL